MIIKFKLFEVRLSDQYILHKKSDTLNKKNHSFDDAPLIREINIDGHILKFDWNHSPQHNLYDKIKTRTGVKCICELNDIFEKTIKQIIPKEIGIKGKIDKPGKYALYLKENKFFFIVNINKEDLINGYRVDFYGNQRPYSMFVRTIHSNSSLKKENYHKIIKINDEDFNL